MANLHSASPREITSPFPHEIISKLHSKACNYLYKFVSFTTHTHKYNIYTMKYHKSNTIANLVPYTKHIAEKLNLSEISPLLTNQHSIPLFSLFAVKKSGRAR